MSIIQRKRSKKIVKKVESLKEECAKRSVYDVRSSLDRVAQVAQNPNTELTFKNYHLAKKALNNVYGFLSKDHVNKIKYECEKVCDIMLSKYLNKSKEEDTIMKSAADINDLQDSIIEIDRKIKANNDLMERSVGKDEITWRRANASNKALKQKRALYKKQFDESLIFMQNLEACASARDIRQKYTDSIIKKQSVVNTEEFVDNIDTMNYVNDEINQQSDIISQKLYESNNEEIDDEYRRACEEHAAANLKDLSTQRGSEEGIMLESANQSL